MAFTTQSTAATIPTSITHAINFLTRPLASVHAPTKVVSLQLILQSTLMAIYMPTPRTTHPRITLSLSPTSIPPRPIYAACIASGLPWSEWISALGGATFDLIIDPSHVTVKVDGKTATVWQAAPAIPPFTRGGSSIQASLRATVTSALARAKSRTLAQQLLESDHENEEAQEIFTMISNTTMISPTPTRGQFHIKLPVSPPSPDSSRPSSRSSNVSDFSFSSSEESMTSVSSQSSFTPAKPAPLVTGPARTYAMPRNESATRVFVDSSKKEITKYSYAGGVSTVLTGGVMLGGCSQPNQPAKPVLTRPIWTRKARTPVSGKNAANNDNWRRAACA